MRSRAPASIGPGCTAACRRHLPPRAWSSTGRHAVRPMNRLRSLSEPSASYSCTRAGLRPCCCVAAVAFERPSRSIDNAGVARGRQAGTAIRRHQRGAHSGWPDGQRFWVLCPLWSLVVLERPFIDRLRHRFDPIEATAQTLMCAVERSREWRLIDGVVEHPVALKGWPWPASSGWRCFCRLVDQLSFD